MARTRQSLVMINVSLSVYSMTCVLFIQHDVIISTYVLCREPRGFAFVEFWDSRDASEARRHMNNKMLCGREIKVVTAVGKRKRPDGGVRYAISLTMLEVSSVFHFS